MQSMQHNVHFIKFNLILSNILFVVCLLFVCCLFVVCLLFVCCLFVVCLLFVCCLFVVCLLFVCCLFVVCLLFVVCCNFVRFWLTFFKNPFLKGKILRSSTVHERGVNSILTTILRF